MANSDGILNLQSFGANAIDACRQPLARAKFARTCFRVAVSLMSKSRKRSATINSEGYFYGANNRDDKAWLDRSSLGRFRQY